MKSAAKLGVSILAALVSVASSLAQPVPGGTTILYTPPDITIPSSQAQSLTGRTYSLTIEPPSQTDAVYDTNGLQVTLNIAFRSSPPAVNPAYDVADFIYFSDSAGNEVAPTVTFLNRYTSALIYVTVKIPEDALEDGSPGGLFSWNIKPLSWGAAQSDVQTDDGHTVNGTARSRTVPATGPAIDDSGQPVSLTVTSGDDASFSVTATGSGRLSYLWRKNGTPIDSNLFPSARTDTLVLTDVLTSAAGIYSVVVTGEGTATSNGATLTVLKIVPTVSISDASFTYDGDVKSVASAVTDPSGLPVTLSYTLSGSTASPVNAGVYTAVATVAETSEIKAASDTATLTINKADQTIAFTTPPPSSVTVGGLSFNLTAFSKRSGTEVATGLPLTYVSSQPDYASVGPLSGEVSIGVAGTTTITISQTGSQNYNAATSVEVPLIVNPLVVKVTPLITWGPIADITVGTALSGVQLNATASYLGLPVSGTFTYSPAITTVLPVGTHPLAATFTPENGLLYDAASAPNSITVVESPSDVCGTAIVRHAPKMNGNAGVQGSLHMLLPESVTLNGNAWISDSFFVPGMPKVKTTGHSTYGSSVVGTGSASPKNYTVTLHGNVIIGNLVRRTNAVTMPTVAAPPSAMGTRDVKLNKPSDSAGNFATVRDLTVNGNVGQVTLPAGTYRDITVNGNSTLVVGQAGATQPSTYNLRKLTLSGTSVLKVVGPVVIVVADDTTFNGNTGNSAHPEWLNLNLYRGDLTLNGNVKFYGNVLAPCGEVTINGLGVLCGGLICDRLTLNGNALVDLCGCDDHVRPNGHGDDDDDDDDDHHGDDDDDHDDDDDDDDDDDCDRGKKRGD